MKYILVILALLFTNCHGSDKLNNKVANEYEMELAVCGIFHNDAAYLKEWVDYHLLMGAKYFYLYNHNSTDNFREVLKPYVDSGLVELVDWFGDYTVYAEWNQIQCSAYEDALKKCLGKTKWLAIVDTDEFIIPLNNKNIPEFLRDYEQFGGICINWQMYGTSHVACIPEGQLLIENLVMKAPTNHFRNLPVKSIVRPETVAMINNPHFVIYKEGFYQVNSNKEKFENAFAPYVLVDKIRINHYWTRDEKFFHDVKMKRYSKWGGNGHPDILKTYELFNSVFDDTMVQFLKGKR